MNKEIFYKLPQAFVRKLQYIYPDQYQDILASFTSKKQSSFRVNYLKTDLPNLRKELASCRIKTEELTVPKGGFILNSPFRQFQETNIYKKGLVYVQNISSMFPPLVLGAQNSDKVLDLCAAPGAKTTQIISLAPQTTMIAVEKGRVRYYKLLANLAIQGVRVKKPLPDIERSRFDPNNDGVKDSLSSQKIKEPQAIVYIMDGIWARKKFPEYFSKILVDTPCSTEGRFEISNPRTFKYWQERKVHEMVRTQKKLMYAAFHALASGGTLVYSTCTFSPEENEGVIDWFLDKFSSSVSLVPIDIPIPGACEGLRRWHNQKYSATLRLTRRIIPNNRMEGFFIAKIKKTG